MQTIAHAGEARMHTRSKPCKRSAKRISVSTNPLFNHVYSTQVPSNNRKYNHVLIYIIDVMHKLEASPSYNNKEAGAIITFVTVSLMESCRRPSIAPLKSGL